MECEATQAYMPRISREPRELWVDCGKLLGNLLVVLLHTTDTLQWSDTVQNGSVVAVTFLLFLAGYTSYASAARYYARPDRGPVFYEILRRLKGVLPAYAVATFALLVVENRGFQLETYLDALLHFNATSAFYYIFIYCQLTVLSPALYLVVRRFGMLGRAARAVCHALFAAILIGFSYFCAQYTYTLPLFGGGRMLFGGTFLLAYYAGMLFAAGKHPARTAKRSAITAGGFLALSALCVWFMNRYGYLAEDWIGCAFGPGYNPPGLTLLVYGACFTGFVYALCRWMEASRCLALRKIVRGWAWCGRYAIYVFLYHRLLQAFPLSMLSVENLAALRALHVCVLMGVPILGGWLWSRIKRSFRVAAPSEPD